jgi:hypothetical protein
VHRNGFEGKNTSWIKGSADVSFQEIAHLMSDQAPHDGQRCEYLKITSDQGTYIFYQYPISRAPINEELSASLWVKANRPGVQLLARVVLPHERDPNNLDDRLTTVIRGDSYRLAGRWQRLEIGRPVVLMKQQQQLMQAQLKRPVNFTDAYLDALLVNVYTGKGMTEVSLDDLEVGPVIEPATAQKESQPAGKIGVPPTQVRPPSRAVVVEFNGDQLLVGGKRFFFRGIRHSDTPLKTLRDAGLNTVWFDYATSAVLVQKAVDLGFWVVPALPAAADDPHLTASQAPGHEVSRFAEPDAVLFWDLGGALAYEQRKDVLRFAQQVRGADPGRPLGADVWDGLLPYSRGLNLLGIHRWPLMTSLELLQYRDWLEQRRRLAMPGSFLWTWVQTHLPDWYMSLVYDRSPERPTSLVSLSKTAKNAFDEPIGPQPEQIRLLTYTALASGCRGIGYWSDRFLADSHQGRDRLLAIALLNQEIEMLEPLLVTVDGPPFWIDTKAPEVKAAVLRTPRGVLVLPIWLGSGSQFVPGQSATSQLTMTIPTVPKGTQAWEVTPGEVKHVSWKRVSGGYEVTLPEFGLTTALVFTADTSLIVRFQDLSRARWELASQWTRDLAKEELAKVQRVQQQLELVHHTVPDASKLLKDAETRLKTCEDKWKNGLYSEAYREGQRALRPVRILMHKQWKKAIEGLDTPVASPYAVSFFTLPQHWQFMEAVRKGSPGKNVLPGGDFELMPNQPQMAWTPQESTLDEVVMTATRVSEIVLDPPKTPGPTAKPATPPVIKVGMSPAPESAKPPAPSKEKPKEGARCLMLQIKAKNPELAPKALERSFLAINSPAVKLPAGSLVQISGWVRIPKAITGSVDGALLYDSAAGEPLGVRLTEPTGWKKFTLYRRVPASGMIHVTLALTGLGTVYFDDVRIEPIGFSAGQKTLTPVAGK